MARDIKISTINPQPIVKSKAAMHIAPLGKGINTKKIISPKETPTTPKITTPQVGEIWIRDDQKKSEAIVIKIQERPPLVMMIARAAYEHGDTMVTWSMSHEAFLKHHKKK